MSVESYILRVIGSSGHRGVKAFLYACSQLYHLGVVFRHFLYDIGWCKSHRVSLPVVSVGNIVAGGTGKTPFVRALIEALACPPGDVAVLTRGYRSYLEDKSQQISSGMGPIVSAKICGDEPYWLASKTSAAIWVGKDRLVSAKQAVQSPAKLLILEDGFQHRRLSRDIDIVLLDAADLFGGGYYLPRGLLRDLPKRLQNADWIIVNHLENGDAMPAIERELRRWTDAPLIGMGPKYHLEVSWKNAGAFCGIAKPKRFCSAVQAAGCNLVDTLESEDHKLPSFQDLTLWAERCRQEGAEGLICTEKDFVKLPAAFIAGLPVCPLQMTLRCIYNQNHWQEMLQTIKNKILHC